MAWKTFKTQTGIKHNSNCTMAFGNLSNEGICERCDELRNGAKARTWRVAPKSIYYDGGISKQCSHNNGKHQLNSGGYCNNCGAGRDHS